MLRGQLSPLPPTTRTTTPPTLRASPPSNSTHPLIHITDNRFWQASARSLARPPISPISRIEEGRKSLDSLPPLFSQTFFSRFREFTGQLFGLRDFTPRVPKKVFHIYIYSSFRSLQFPFLPSSFFQRIDPQRQACPALLSEGRARVKNHLREVGIGIGERGG